MVDVRFSKFETSKSCNLTALVASRGNINSKILFSIKIRLLATFAATSCQFIGVLSIYHDDKIIAEEIGSEPHQIILCKPAKFAGAQSLQLSCYEV